MMPYAMPPAETKLSIGALVGGYFGSRNDFSQSLGAFLGTATCVLADSARSLLYLVFCHLRAKAGPGKKEVLIPGYTCYSVPAAVVKAGLKVALYDMDPLTFQPDMQDLEQKINNGTLAIVGQHLLGVRSDIAGLTEIAHKYKTVCIEDSAQRLEAPLRSRKQATPADFTVFSFGRGKPLPLGSGGALIASNSEDLAFIAGKMETYPEKAGKYLMPGVVRVFSNPRVYWVMEKLPLGLGRTIYDPSFAVSNMPRLYQRIGNRGIAELDKLNKHRAAIGNIYSSHFSDKRNSPFNISDLPLVRYPLLVKNRKPLSQLTKYGIRQLYPLALSDLPPLQDSLATPRARVPGAREIADRLITLPTHLSVNKYTASHILEKISKADVI